MNVSDHILSFLLAVLLHVLGLLVVGNQASRMAAVAATVPELDVTSVELSLAESEADSPEPRPPSPEPPALELPQPAEPALPEVLPEKPDFTEALTPPPLPVLQPQPSPVAVPQSAPPPDEPPRPAVGAAPPATAPAPSAPQATLQPVSGGGGSVGRVDAHPSLERAIKPNYPIGARRRGEEGTVILDVTVAADGSASKVVKVSSSGFEDLDRAAERAAERARFKPGTRDGKPVESAARLTLIFRLRDA